MRMLPEATNTQGQWWSSRIPRGGGPSPLFHGHRLAQIVGSPVTGLWPNVWPGDWRSVRKSPDTGRSGSSHRGTGAGEAAGRQPRAELAGNPQGSRPLTVAQLCHHPPLLKNARTHRMRAASQTGGGTRVAVAPGGEERFPIIHRWLTGHHVRPAVQVGQLQPLTQGGSPRWRRLLGEVVLAP